MSSASARRLPSVRFEAQAANALEALPRMDVAAFVGFASSGPLHCPVAVEDLAEFEAVFGQAPALAWDGQRGEQVHGHLASTVRGFFRNGGRRCWVVRVAGASAHCNLIALPGLLRRAPTGQISWAVVQARSEGSWSDTVRAAATLSSEVLELRAWSASGSQVELTVTAPEGVAPGDLLRLTLPGTGYTVMVPVQEVHPLSAASTVSTASGGTPLRVVTRQAVWMSKVKGLGSGPLKAHWRQGRTQVSAQGRRRGGDTPLILTLSVSREAMPEPGTVLHVEGHNLDCWFSVETLTAGQAGTSVQVSGSVVRVRDAAPKRSFGSSRASTCERLTLGLWTRHGEGPLLRMEGLGFCSRHPRFWGALPTDAERASQEEPGPFRLSGVPGARFPLAGEASQDESFFLPLGMETLPTRFIGCFPSPREQRKRDGLEQFSAGLFLDEALQGLHTESLVAQAHFLRDQGNPPRSLRGIYSLLSREDVTLISVPDAVHRAWAPMSAPAVPLPLPLPRESVTTPEGGDFRACSPQPLAAPERSVSPSAGQVQAFSFAAAPESRWVLEPLSTFSEGALLAVQRALLRLCHARGDLLAVLCLPEHFREEQTLRHVTRLRSPLATPPLEVPALGPAEENALSHGALYHPWPLFGDEAQPSAPRRMPPDGAACGIMARRALTRGAWTAPANEPWRGVVALAPSLSTERWEELQEAQVNLVRQQPQGFLTLSADTLARDPELRPISVRRLLCLLRKAALRLGATYVFEPNDPAFHRLVQRGFEALLGELFTRGAFAGSTRDRAFQVVTHGGRNAPTPQEQGFFIVDLKVAPSSPLLFIHVRLVQSGDRGLSTEER